MDLLVSIDPDLRAAAESELRKRGLHDTEISLARRLTAAEVRVRLDLIDELPRRTDVDPRTWLFWLAEDSEQLVRDRARAALATFDDPNIRMRLKELLITDSDSRVAEQIGAVKRR